MIYAIVTADKNWGIGKNGRQITTIPDDIRYIRSVTSGQNVIMGRKTFQSYPVGQIPENRNNIVLTTDTGFRPHGAAAAGSVEEAIRVANESKKDIYVLGGASVFKEMLPYFDEIQVTAIDYSYDVDCYFPDIDKMPEWVLVEESEEQTHFDTVYYLRRYLKRRLYKA